MSDSAAPPKRAYTGPEVPDLSVQTEEGPGTLYLTGSQHFDNKRDFAVAAEFTRRAVGQAAEKGIPLLVGDGPYGVDGVAVSEANRLGYENVTVVGMGDSPRNGGVANGEYVHIETESVIERDRWMIGQAGRGLVVSNGQDKGSYAIHKRLQERGVPSDLVDIPRALERSQPASGEPGKGVEPPARRYTGPEVPDLTVEGREGAGSVYVAGSRYFKEKRDFAMAAEFTNRTVDQAMEKGMEIYVGDNPYGVDRLAVDRVNKAGYEHVVVVGLDGEPRNGGAERGTYVQVESEVYADRDRWMADHADRGVFVWNRESPGTYAAYSHMKGLGKPVDLARFGPEVQRNRVTPAPTGAERATEAAEPPAPVAVAEPAFKTPDLDR